MHFPHKFGGCRSEVKMWAGLGSLCKTVSCLLDSAGYINRRPSVACGCILPVSSIHTDLVLSCFLIVETAFGLGISLIQNDLILTKDI